MTEGVAINPDCIGLFDHLVAKDVGQERCAGLFDDGHVDVHDLSSTPNLDTLGCVLYIIGAI